MLGKHASFSPSASERWLACPASLVRQRMMQDAEDRESKPAAEGTLAHAIAEVKLRVAYEGLKPTTGKTRITKLKKTHLWEGQALYAPEMEECTDDYLAYIAGIYNQCRLPKLWIELPVTMEPLTTEMFGTSDCVVIDNNVLHVIDYKHGRGVEVSAERNTQGMLYAYGVLCHPEVQMLYAPQRVVIHIFQPRAGGPSSYELTTDELLAWIDAEVRPTVEGILSGALGGEFHAGAKQCKFCPYRGRCKECYNEGTGQNAGLPKPQEEYDPHMMSSEELAKALTRCEILKIFMKGAEEEAHARILAGKEVTGWQLYPRRGRRTWNDAEVALKQIAKGEDINVAMLWDKVPLSVAQVEGVIGKKNMAKYDGLVGRTEAAPMLKPLDNRKIPYDPGISIAEDFADVPLSDGALPF